MSGYIRETIFNGEFDGKPVTAKLTPLSLKDLLRLEGRDVKDDSEAALAIAEVLPQYVVDLQGPTDATGKPVDIHEVCSSAYFFELTMSMGRSLITAARPPRKPSSPSAS